MVWPIGYTDSGGTYKSVGIAYGRGLVLSGRAEQLGKGSGMQDYRLVYLVIAMQYRRMRDCTSVPLLDFSFSIFLQ